MYKNVKEKPDRGQLCLCKCPDWCSLGFQVAEFDGRIFNYPDAANDSFNEHVEEWMPLNEDGEPE